MKRLSILSVLVATPAMAHTGIDHVHTVTSGLLHPLLGADHLLAMVLVGVWAAVAGGNRLWVWPATFVGGMTLGALASSGGATIAHIEPAIAASVIAFGLLAAMAVRAPIALGAALIAAIGAAHGFAHGAEAPAGSFAAYASGFLFATAALHLGGVLAVRLIGQRMARIAAAAGAVAGLAMVLA